MKDVTIIKYNAGNILSVKNALDRLGISYDLTDDPSEILSAKKVIFPGVGEASSTMAYLRKTGLDQVIPKLTCPTLGICLGMQLMCAHSAENDTECLGIFPLEVNSFKALKEDINTIHLGWNKLSSMKGELFEDLPLESYVYFVHGFYVKSSKFDVANATYGTTFAAAIQRDNFYACQFHPEKSGDIGHHILKNFMRL